MCRFGLKIFVDLPDFEDRKLFLTQRLMKDQKDILDLNEEQFKDIVENTNGMSQRGKGGCLKNSAILWSFA